jgi:hypothetical protein
VSVTRGIPSMATCAKGHRTDRRDVLRREPADPSITLSDALALPEIKALVDALERCVASIRHADMADGVCCCGEEMATHSNPMHCGHSPVDAGEHFASLCLESAEAALAALTDKTEE